MKKFFLLLISAVVGLSVFAQTSLDAVIFGSISNTKEKSIKLQFQNNPLDDTLQTITIELNEIGQFYLALPIKRPLDAILVCNNQKQTIFIDPEERIEIKADANFFSSTIQFIQNAKNNEYAHLYRQKFDSEQAKSERNLHIINDSPSKYKYYEDSLYKAKVYFLEEFTTGVILSKQFLRRQKAAYRYGNSNFKYRYANNYLYLTGLQKELPKDYYSFMPELSVRENDLITVKEFYDYLENYFTYRYNEENPTINTEKELVSFEYNLAQSLYEERVKNIFLTKKFAELLDNHPYEYTKNYISEFMSTVYSNEFRAYIDKKIQQASLGIDNTKAFDFLLKDKNGNNVQLSDFKGKVVYLNFWASWCLPCLAEIENHNQIQQQYKDKDFITIMVSVDEDLKAWKKTLSKYDKQIIQLNMKGMKNETARMYNLKNIPKSVVINKDGIIIHADVPAPSHADIYKYLIVD